MENILLIKLLAGSLLCLFVILCLWYDERENKKEEKRKEISRQMRNRNVHRAAHHECKYIRYGDEKIRIK